MGQQVVPPAAAPSIMQAAVRLICDIRRAETACRQSAAYIAASAILALTYAMIGVILAPLFGRVAGVLIAFAVPFLDLGIAQDPMLHPSPPTWAHLLPGYRGSRVLTSAVLTHSFSQTGPMLTALAWLAGATVAAALLFRRNMQTARPARPTPPAAASGPAQAQGGLSKPETAP